MSPNNRKARLPAPHDAITIEISEWSVGGSVRVSVKYNGTPADLMAAAVVDFPMIDKIRNQRAGAMLAERFNSHFRVRGKLGMAKRAVWERENERCTVEFSTCLAALLRLPHVEPLYPDGVVYPRNSQEGSSDDVQSVLRQFGAYGSAVREIEQKGAASRCRVVGRRRREASWYAIGKVLYVDWLGIARERVLARV